MGCSGKRHPHQYPLTESRIFFAESLPRKQIQFECPCTDGQLNSMCHVNKKGGTHSKVLNALALETLAWCLQHKITIRAQHVPSKLHVKPDCESRHSNDWQLKPQFIQKYLSPDSVDLFATDLTKHTVNLVSWRPDPEAYHTDAFTLN